MTNALDLLAVALLGLATTSSSLLGVAIGLYIRFPKRVLAAILAFAAGALISALAIELAYESARQLHHHAFGVQSAWAFVGGGFASGAVMYYSATLFLETKGAAIRFPTRFNEYAVQLKRKDAKELIGLLSKSDLLRHLPPDGIEAMLSRVQMRLFDRGEIVFRSGDEANALYIIARGSIEVLAADDPDNAAQASGPIAILGEGQAFGEMALLTGGSRTATIRATTPVELLEIGKDAFEDLVSQDRQLANAVQRLSHDRAIRNLSAGGRNSSTWARIASGNIQHLSRNEAARLLVKTGHGAGLAIVLGNILDTIPGCLVIGAKFNGIESLSLTLMLGMFLGGVPEAAVSAAILRRADYSPAAIFAVWSTVLLAGILAAIAGKFVIGSSDSLTAIFSQAVAGGAVLALVVHAMIPEAIHEGGSVVVLPTVCGFLLALYFALLQPLG
jgi:CRP-like cAMP-binding protein